MRTGYQEDKNVVVTTKPSSEAAHPFIPDDFEPEELEPAVKQLGPMCEKQRRHSLKGYYDIGKIVAKHYERVKEERDRCGCSMYGERFFQRVAESLKGVNWQLLYECFKLVGAYSEQAYRELCQHDAITPSHALTLALIGDGQVRSEMQAKIIAEGWTVKELQKALREKYGRQRKAGAGRPLKVSKNVNAAITHLTEQSARFIRLNEQVWFGDAFDIGDEAAEIPANKLCEQFKQKVIAAAAMYDKLAETMSRHGKKLQKAAADIERRMEAQAELDRQQAEEEDETAFCAAS